MTLGYTLILASLFLKTYRLFRIFYGQFKKSYVAKLKYTSAKHQVIMCSALSLVQVIMVLVWIGVDVPGVKRVYPAERVVKVCKVGPFHLLVAQSFNIVLCIVTTAYSFFTRNIRKEFNESKFINFAVCFICLAWIIEAVRSVFANSVADNDVSQNPERDWAISTAANSCSASLALMALFTHRVYKILGVKETRDTINCFLALFDCLEPEMS